MTIADRRCLQVLLAAIALCVAVVPAHAGGDAASWLARMTGAMHDQAYRGRLVYQHDDQLEAMTIIHGRIDGRVMERVHKLGGEPFDIIRRGDQTVCVWPGKGKTLSSRRVRNPLGPRPPRGLEDLPAQYRAILDGSGRVAGRAAQRLRIEPVDAERYGYRLWIDRATGLLLRSDLISPDHEVLERFLFTDIEPLESVHARQFEPDENSEATVVRHDVPSRQPPPAGGTIRWTAAAPPAGFRLLSSRWESMPGTQRPVRHLVYGDGLATVSVFIEPADHGDAMPDGPLRLGAANCFVRTRGDKRLVVVGEVPATTVRRIARGLRPA